VDKKLLENLMKNNNSIIYQRTKVQKLGSPKNERAEKN
jgi:hypothetical protein